MINPAELVRRPVRQLAERDFLSLPIATDNQAIEYFGGKIEEVKGVIVSRFKASNPRFTNRLLHISSEEYSVLENLRMERGRAQDLLFQVMINYGIDQEKSIRQFKMDSWSGKIDEDITKNPDGTRMEVFLYPSQTIKHLYFRRTHFFVTDTGQTTDVIWEVVSSFARLTPRIHSVRKI